MALCDVVLVVAPRSRRDGPDDTPACSADHKTLPDPKPFPGLTTKPLCDACEHVVAPCQQVSPVPPPLLMFTRGRRRALNTQQHFCPDQECAYYGWVGRGNIRANGHPGGGRWRQLQCVVCHTYFQETWHADAWHACVA